MIDIKRFSDIYVLDFGGQTNAANISRNGQLSTVINFDKVLRLPFILSQNSLVICEDAHLGCPKEESLAQPFSSTELLQLYKDFKNNNIELRLFPHSITPNALAKYKIKHPNAEKSDKLDPIIIYEYITAPDIFTTLKKPVKYFESKLDIIKRQANNQPKNIREEYWIIKKQLNRILNIARKDGYDILGIRNDKITQIIVDNFNDIYSQLVEEFDSTVINTIFDLELTKRGDKLKNWRTGKTATKQAFKFKMNLMYSIAATIVDENGSPRLRNNGRLPSVYHIMRYVLCFTPHHLKGGIARSNIYWHGFKNYLRKIHKDSDKKEKTGFYQILTIKEKDNSNEDKVKKVSIRRGSFTKKENEFFVKTRKEYIDVLKKLNRILRHKLLPNLYDKNGYFISNSSSHLN
jgi:hypothetical protein